jgi:hypothetical protein
MESIETINYKGYDINIYPDDMAESPREWDNLGHIVCFHRRYDLGDKHDLTTDMFEGREEMERYLIKKKKAIIIAPLFLYDHSVLRIKIGSFYGLLPQGHAEFDSGQIGFIYATEEDIRKEYGVKKITKKLKERVRELLENEVKIYDNYIRGYVFAFIVEKDGEVIDSCGGYFGDIEKSGLLDEAHNNIERHIKETLKKHSNKRKAQIKNKVALKKREPLNIKER